MRDDISSIVDVLPWWQGMGKLHAKTGDYLLFVWIAPQTRDVRGYTRPI
jgi:hypothetical protein